MDLDAQRNLLRRRLLGRGLALTRTSDLGRDLVLRADGTDLEMVDGVDNLAQALSVAVLTPLGGDVFNLEFGFDGLNALVDETTPLLQRERVRISIVKLLRNDPRVARVVDVRLIDSRLDQPTTGAARLLDVRVVFEAVTGDALTLSAGNAGARLSDG
jgi:phage baseplate assembly protein W